MILINGGSWTGGRRIEAGNYWPDFLKENTTQSVVNLGLGGSSNQRIYRSTVDFLYSTENTVNILIIGWSFIERDELPCFVNDNSNSNYFRITSREVYYKNDLVPDPVKKSIHNIYYKWCFNQNKNIKLFLLNALAIQDICYQKNIKLVNFFSFQNIFNLCDTEDLIVLKNKLNMNLWIEQTMKDYTSDFPLTHTGHTNEDGNRFWADFIMEKIKF